MTFVARRELIGHAGVSTETTCEMWAASDFGAEVTLRIAGQTIPITMAAVGTDVPIALTVTEAGYLASFTVTGLASNTSYEYTLTQGALTFTGTLETAAGAADNWALILFSCNGGDGTDYQGGWSFVEQYAKKNPLVNPDGLPIKMVIGVDDAPTYLDSMEFDDTAGSGHKLYATSDPEYATEYDACTRFFTAFGMREGATETTRVIDAKGKTRTWCYDNLNQMWLAGDHGYFNDVGYGATAGTARLAGTGADAYQTLALFQAKEAAWDLFCTSVNGQFLDVESKAFSWDCGYFQFIGLDRNYGDGSNREGGGAFLYSQNQINGAVSAVTNSDARFRVLGSSAEYHTNGVNDIWTMDQNAVSGIVTNNVNSIMAKHVADGSKWIKFTGDLHAVRITQHNKDSGGTEIQEQFLEYNVAAMSNPNGGLTFIPSDIPAAEPLKGWYDWAAGDYLTGIGVNPEWRRVWDHSEIPGFPSLLQSIKERKIGNCVLMEFYGSEPVKRTVVSIVNSELARDTVDEYLDDSGDNLPSEKVKMSIL